MDKVNSSKVCAYCGQSCALTVEHIWPKCILTRTNYKMRYSAASKKTFSGDLTIKDVCEECNNGGLSLLDDYLCNLYDQYFVHTPMSGKSVKFQYDFSCLMRALLKISYNAARMAGSDVELLKSYAPLLISQYAVSPICVAVFVDIAKACWKKNQKTGKRVKLLPKGTRCGPAVLSELDYHSWCSVRVIIINGFRFTIFLFKQSLHDLQAVKGVLARVSGVPLVPQGVVEIPTPTLTTVDFYDGIQSWPPLRSK